MDNWRKHMKNGGFISFDYLLVAIFVVIVIVAFALLVVEIQAEEDRAARAYEIIVPTPKLTFYYYCNHVSGDGGKLILADCWRSPRITVENKVNVQIIERPRRND
jgi:hypothetical protein